MARKLYKWKLLLDENMPSRQRFPRLNSRFDIKHVRDDFHATGSKDPAVYEIARTSGRLLITFNGDDFQALALKSTETGVISISPNMRNDQIDTKLTALLTKGGKGAFLGKMTNLSPETVS
jgi:predicted nuclease of predicted toxin-antitoxin system